MRRRRKTEASLTADAHVKGKVDHFVATDKAGPLEAYRKLSAGRRPEIEAEYLERVALFVAVPILSQHAIDDRRAASS